MSARAAIATGVDARAIERAAARLADQTVGIDERSVIALDRTLASALARHPDRSRAARYEHVLEVVVDRPLARFSAWYEFFPRSFGHAGRHGTFADAERMLRYVANLGFDVAYLPPIHPIGESFRKGKNNSLAVEPGDPGSPWAIGSRAGGHKSVHPELGTLEDFDHFVATAHELGLEVALDIALQCSPDHPYVKEHPEWFRSRPDGTIQYAENPPKKYQDICPFDFECAAWESLWEELCSIFEFWGDRGVRIFRVDNPHTKPIAFWEWCIGRIKERHPETIFLAEAFTRPKVMYALAKVGFSQSYTYFTWRRFKDELTEYVTELTQTEVAEFFRPNFWPNTPDILPDDLKDAERGAFLARLVLAATLGGNYGIYGPAFELMANRGRPGSGEYLDNEKYELAQWDLERPDSLQPVIRRLNRIRRRHPALQRNDTLHFHACDNDHLLCYSKTSPDGEDVLLMVVDLDYHHRHTGWIEVDAEALGVADGRALPGARPRQRRALRMAGRPQLRRARSGRDARARLPRPAVPPDRAGLRLLRLSRGSPIPTETDSMSPADPRESLPEDPLWFKDAIVYELHVRGFADSNGDGIGDFRGLIQKLDYLQDLGVTAIWLLPFYPSPLRDDGYDIADYFSVNPAYGTLADFRRFLREAHRRGLRVITELVVNHTSNEHAWFQRARRAPAGSPQRDFYVWSDTPEKYADDAHHLQGLRAVELELGPGRARLLLASLLLAPTRPQLRRSGGARGAVQGRRLLDGHGRRRHAARRGALPVRARGHQLREPPGDARFPAQAPHAPRLEVPRPDAPRRGQPVAGGRGRSTSATATSAT